MGLGTGIWEHSGSDKIWILHVLQGFLSIISLYFIITVFVSATGLDEHIWGSLVNFWGLFERHFQGHLESLHGLLLRRRNLYIRFRSVFSAIRLAAILERLVLVRLYFLTLSSPEWVLFKWVLIVLRIFYVFKWILAWQWILINWNC